MFSIDGSRSFVSWGTSRSDSIDCRNKSFATRSMLALFSVIFEIFGDVELFDDCTEIEEMLLEGRTSSAEFALGVNTL